MQNFFLKKWGDKKNSNKGKSASPLFLKDLILFKKKGRKKKKLKRLTIFVFFFGLNIASACFFFALAGSVLVWGLLGFSLAAKIPMWLGSILPYRDSGSPVGSSILGAWGSF